MRDYITLSNLTRGGWIYLWVVLAVVIDVIQDLPIMPAQRTPIYRKWAPRWWNPMVVSLLIVILLFMVTP